MQQRKSDTLAHLTNDEDAWVASADSEGNAYLLPLSFVWDGTTITIATPEASRMGRNLRAARGIRLGFGPTRDVVLVDGTVEPFTLETVPEGLADAFAAKLWDPRKDDERQAFFRITPHRIQAWREVNELPGRVLMRGGRWLA